MNTKQKDPEDYLEEAEPALTEVPLTPYIVRFIMENGQALDFNFTVSCEEIAIKEAKRHFYELQLDLEHGQIMVIKVRIDGIHPKYYGGFEPIFSLGDRDEPIIVSKEKTNEEEKMNTKQKEPEEHLEEADHALTEVPLTLFLVRFIMESGGAQDFAFRVRCEEEAIEEAKRILNETMVDLEHGQIMVIKVRIDGIHPKYYEAEEPILYLDDKDEGIIAIREKIKKETDEYLRRTEGEREE